MRIFLGLLGASLGVIAGFYFVGSALGDLYLAEASFRSPDEAGNAHMAIFAGTTVVMMLLGYFIGYFVGWRMDREDRQDH